MMKFKHKWRIVSLSATMPLKPAAWYQMGYTLTVLHPKKGSNCRVMFRWNKSLCVFLHDEATSWLATHFTSHEAVVGC